MLFLVALCGLAAWPGTASAAVFDIAIFADVTGTNSVAACGPGQTFPNCSLQDLPYSASIAQYVGPTDLVQGDNPFSYGGYYTFGLLTGTINNDNGVLTGRDLTFSRASCSGPCPGDHIYATASTFRVTGGVPEPETWALLVVGIGAVASTLRHAKRRRAPAGGALATA